MEAEGRASAGQSEPQLGSDQPATIAVSCAGPRSHSCRVLNPLWPNGQPARSCGCCHRGKARQCRVAPRVLRSHQTAPRQLLYLGSLGAAAWGRADQERDLAPSGDQHRQRSSYSCACTTSYVAGGRFTVTTATNLSGVQNRQKEGRRGGRGWLMRLLLRLLLLLVSPEVGLDGDGRLLGRIAEELALAAGIGGHGAWDDNRASR